MDVSRNSSRALDAGLDAGRQVGSVTHLDGVARVDAAWRFAVQAHGEQKYGSEPYSVHLREVMNGCMHLGFTQPAHLMAAALHDVIEDTDVDQTALAAVFGQDVARVVAELSHDHNVGTKDYLAAMSDTAFAVKLADRLANVERMGLLENSPDRAAYLLAKYQPEMALFADESARRGFDGACAVLAAAFAATTTAIQGAVDSYTLQQGVDRIEARRERVAGAGDNDNSVEGAAHVAAMGGKKPITPSSSPLFVRTRD